MISAELHAQSLPWQIALFGLVGVANTALDFVIYNLLTRKIPRIPANICSTSVAMAFSFTANFFVFQPHTFDAPGQATKFIIVTAVSLYVIQNVVIYLTTNVWMQPVRWANSATHKIQLASGWSEAFVSKNTVKLLATGCSLVWNFLWYRFYVYV
ncbi:MAG: GtrA family protein [Limisphaerales bacterium]